MVDFQEELAPFFFLLEESEVISEAREDWQPWGPFTNFEQVSAALEKLDALTVVEKLEAFGFFILWESVKASLPKICAKRFEEYPPNEEHVPGAILSDLTNPERFDSFFEDLCDYLTSIDEDLEERVLDSEEKLEKWWETKRSETLDRIWIHSEKMRVSLIS